nr:uncharacterized protein CTRU02_03145 [Colletotrichum truncatum]KAF6797114.1 hypothetical protein CTRU02_03145 [Colletotrichum truncatum]
MQLRTDDIATTGVPGPCVARGRRFALRRLASLRLIELGPVLARVERSSQEAKDRPGRRACKHKEGLLGEPYIRQWWCVVLVGHGKAVSGPFT